MKKIILSLVALLLNSACFALVNSKNSCQPALIYCPQQVTCSQDGNIKSCAPTGSKLEYWNLDEMSNNGRVAKGVYTFSSTASTYQHPSSEMNQVSCNYLYNSSPIPKSIYFPGKKSAYLEAAVNNSKSWYGSGYYVGCSASNTGACPFVEPGLFINKLLVNNPSVRVKAKLNVNGNLINVDNGPGNQNSSLVAYDEAFPACGGVQQCKIEINLDTSTNGTPTYPIYIGSVVVDMMSDMKIAQVISSPCSGYIMKKVEPFNTIMFEKSNQMSCKQ